MLLYSMSVSVDGYIADRDGAIEWHEPSDELFAFHLARVRGLGAYLCGRRLYETMLPWESDPSLRATEMGAEFAEVWCALPKVVFSRTLDRVEGKDRLAQEIAATLVTTPGDVEIGGAQLAAGAIARGMVDEFHTFRIPIVLGGGAPYFPPTEAISLDLIETCTFDPGVIFERYRRVRSNAG